MFPRRWADYEEDEDLPVLPWKQSPVKKVGSNFFSVLSEDTENEEDFCLGCETGTDVHHTCC